MLTMTPDTSQSATVCRRFTVVGMTRSHCEHAIATEIAALADVTHVTADAAASTVTVESTRELDIAAVSSAVVRGRIRAGWLSTTSS